MKGLYKYLPPFAPDYSGVCSVLFNLNGIVIIHDASGCTGNFTGYDEPRWYGSNAAIFSSGLREIEAVLGDDERLINRIMEAVERMPRNFVALLGSPAPAVIGVDMQALARILKARSGLPVLSFDTTGIKYYDTGASQAYLEIARNFVKPWNGKKQALVNILGAIPLDMGKGKRVRDIGLLLRQCGFSKVYAWGQNAGLKEISQAGAASLNLVVAYSGLAVARYLHEHFATPYMVGIPIGQGSTNQFMRTASSVLGLETQPRTTPYLLPPNTYAQALVIGEQVMAGSIRSFLRLDWGIRKVDVASFFAMDKELWEEGDKFLEEEDDLSSLCQRENYDLIIGDPLYENLLGANQGRFIHFPHVAVSSRLYWDNEPACVGKQLEGLSSELKTPARRT
ncbi:nitrogenase component 1 [Syntrophomonas wolfei]|jgi:nitrogenase molybdenum-iron protein alpha/beta subunit|nr:nitrogenase component 1 [Syntrophomonas wolfei]